MDQKIKKAYLPLSESAFYILLSLREPRHGYGVILHVKELTGDRIVLGAGTIYGTLTKFEKDNIIQSAGEEDRRKLYKLTELGQCLLNEEYLRITELYENGRKVLGGNSHD